MKTKEIVKLLKDWNQEYLDRRIGQGWHEFIGPKIKQHFQRRKPKCVWFYEAGLLIAEHNGVKQPFTSKIGFNYFPMCGGKIEVKND